MNESEIIQQNQVDIRLIAEHINSVLQGFSEIIAVYLLGSVISGRMRKDSDIDIALLLESGEVISLQARLEMAMQLEEKLGRTVDIGVITSNNLIYASEVILTGKRIITVREDDTNIAENNLLGCYLVFKDDRKEVEESYRAA